MSYGFIMGGNVEHDARLFDMPLQHEPRSLMGSENDR